MKSLSKGIIILVVALVILNITSTSYAQSMANKLNRGLTNIVTGWFEIPKNMSAATAKHDFVSAFFIGLPKGLWMTVVRTGAGVYDTVTFPIPFPKDYKPVLEPEFIFTDKKS